MAIGPLVSSSCARLAATKQTDLLLERLLAGRLAAHQARAKPPCRDGAARHRRPLATADVGQKEEWNERRDRRPDDPTHRWRVLELCHRLDGRHTAPVRGDLNHREGTTAVGQLRSDSVSLAVQDVCVVAEAHSQTRTVSGGRDPGVHRPSRLAVARELPLPGAVGPHLAEVGPAAVKEVLVTHPDHVCGRADRPRPPAHVRSDSS
jgi:hypothetical protein